MRMDIVLRQGDHAERVEAEPGETVRLHGVHPETVVTVARDGALAVLTVDAAARWADDLTVEVEFTVPGGSMIQHPMHEGIVERRAPSPSAFEFRGPGWSGEPDDAHRLGLPLVLVEGSRGPWLIGADPGFTTRIRARTLSGELVVVLSWVFRHEAGVHHDLRRRIVSTETGDMSRALDAWFAAVLPDIPPGPAWLHEIAWTNYDYLSKNGRGWFADIDAFVELSGGRHNGRAAFTLHGWYDRIGRYTFDCGSGRLDEEWMAFPFIHHPELLAIEGKVDPRIPPAYTMRNLRAYDPVPMSWGSIRERLDYAKDRGIRVPFYLAAGLMGVGDAAEHAAAGDGLQSETGLWVGPDAVGSTYLMNPLHADTRSRVLAYVAAVLDRIGDLVDALVIDETCFIPYGQLGPSACPGYADLAQAELVAEIGRMCHERSPELAVLTADQMGLQIREQESYPYALYADGIYQDTFCHAQLWEAARFPTWRNVAWSCNWAPSSTMPNTKWAVMAFDGPISTSNGCFGDDTGIAELGDDDRATLLALWGRKLDGSRSRRLTIVDVA